MNTENRFQHHRHVHVWERSLSRRQFMGTTAAATGLALSSAWWMPELAQAAGPDPLAGLTALGGAMPTPILGGTKTPFGVFIHHHPFPPDPLDPQEIGNFEGFVGLIKVSGTGTGTDTKTGATTPLLFATDSGFMTGCYIGMDGNTHSGTFAFI